MAFGNIATFYLPVAASAGTSQWGTDVRKLLSAADAGSDATTITDHGTNLGAVVRTCDPYNSKATDDVQANFGWAITPADMGSVAGALRFFPAGNHVLTARVQTSSAVGVNLDVQFSVFRVGPAAGRTRTLLGSATGSATVGNAAVTIAATVALGEVVFAADETYQISCEISTAGLAVVGKTATFYTGTQGAVEIRVTTPGLKVLAETTGSTSGIAVASGVGAPRFAGVGTSSGTGAATGVGAPRFAGVGSSVGAGSASGVGAPIFSGTGTAAGAGSAVGVGAPRFAGVAAASGSGATAAVGTSIFSGVAVGAGSASSSGVGAPIFSGVGSAVGAGDTLGLGSSVAASVGAASGTGTATGQITKVLGAVGTVNVSQGGGTTVIVRKFFPIFED